MVKKKEKVRADHMLKKIEDSIPQHLLPRGKVVGGPKLKEISGLEQIDLHQVVRMYLTGLTDLEVAFNLKISEHTLLQLKSECPELRDAIELGREASLDRVEQSLYRRAIGYTVKEVTKEPALYYDITKGTKVLTNKKLHTTRVVTKELPADIGAAMRVLTNRRSNKWKDASPVNIANNSFTFNPVAVEAIDADVLRRATENSRSLQRHGIIDATPLKGKD